MRITVFGGLGRIGLPFCVYMAKRNNGVVGIDLNISICERANSGTWIPFKEEGLEKAMSNVLMNSDRLLFDVYRNRHVEEADIIFIFVGTHLDQNGNRDYSAIDDVMGKLEKCDLSNKAIVLRSTVEPGTTDRYFERLLNLSKPPLSMYYWPERVLEGKVLEEFDSLPQIIGVPNGQSNTLVDPFIDLIAKMSCRYTICSAREAEFTKVATNVGRMAHFSLANELMLMAEESDVNFGRVYELMTDKYDRMSWLALPGPNVGGPCLSKDYAYLEPVIKTKSNMFSMAYDVNERILESLAKKVIDRKNVLVLGTTFKQESDNNRESRYPYFIDKLWKMGYTGFIESYDPYGESDLYDLPGPSKIREYDAFIVFTPHTFFEEKGYYKRLVRHGNSEAIIVNYWALMGPNEKDSKGFWNRNFPSMVGNNIEMSFVKKIGDLKYV